MKQYCHLLIASDPNFVPSSTQVVAFLEMLKDKFKFQFVKSKKEWLPGLDARTSVTEIRKWNRDPNDERTYMARKWFDLQQTAEIPSLVQSEPEYTVRMSGKWSPDDMPIPMMILDGTLYQGDFTCIVSCDQRSKAVCTGSWYGAGREGHSNFGFDNPESPVQSLGVFTHPCTGKRVEVPGAGSARFWIGFECGKWLVPRMTDGFDVMEPAFVDAVQNCLGIPFIQAGRAVG